MLKLRSPPNQENKSHFKVSVAHTQSGLSSLFVLQKARNRKYTSPQVYKTLVSRDKSIPITITIIFI